MYADKLGYRTVSDQNGLASVGPSGLFGFVAVNGDSAVTIYDNNQASGDKLFEGTLVRGVPIDFGGNGIAAKNGLFFAIAAAVSVNVLCSGSPADVGIGPINLSGFSAGFSNGFGS